MFKTKPLTRLTAALAAPALGLALMAAPAEANVRTAANGASCLIDGFAENIMNGYPRYTQGGGFMWESTATEPLMSALMFCPVKRSLPLSTAGLSDYEMRLRGHSSMASNVSCNLRSVRTDGTILEAHNKSVSVPGGGTATLDFGGLLNTSVSKGTYWVDCLLPVTVEIISLYHSEVDGVSGN